MGLALSNLILVVAAAWISFLGTVPFNLPTEILGMQSMIGGKDEQGQSCKFKSRVRDYAFSIVGYPALWLITNLRLVDQFSSSPRLRFVIIPFWWEDDWWNQD